jgi:hypothetical protein
VTGSAYLVGVVSLLEQEEVTAAAVASATMPIVRISGRVSIPAVSFVRAITSWSKHTAITR